MKNIDDILRRILNSEDFKKHEAESKLLHYIVEASKRGETPDQAAIAIHALGKDDSFNPNVDSIVRVRIHNLRKMLHTYYLSEGAHEKARIEVSQGNYKVKFIPVKPTRHVKSFRIWMICLILIACSALLNVYQWTRSRIRDQASPYLQAGKSSFIWNDFLTSDLPILVVLGNNFYFMKFPKDSTKPYFAIRYSNINSADDLNQYIQSEKDPEYRIEEYHTGLFEYEIVLSVQQLLPLFVSVQKPIEYKPSTLLVAGDLAKFNIIYVGITKNLRVLQSLLKDLHINYEMENFEHHFSVKSGLPDSMRVFTPMGNTRFGPRFDYVILDKLPGPNANHILIITCTDLTGVYEALKLITHPVKSDGLKKYLIGKHGKMPEYFESLLEVSSLSRTGFNIKPLHSFPISPDEKLIRPEITN